MCITWDENVRVSFCALSSILLSNSFGKRMLLGGSCFLIVSFIFFTSYYNVLYCIITHNLFYVNLVKFVYNCYCIYLYYMVILQVM